MRFTQRVPKDFLDSDLEKEIKRVKKKLLNKSFDKLNYTNLMSLLGIAINDNDEDLEYVIKKEIKRRKEI